MLILNYAHPFTDEQLAQLSNILQSIPEVCPLQCHVDRTRPLSDIARELADATGLTPDEWQTTPLVVNLPALSPVAAALLAELHGRCGYFLPVLNIRPIPDTLPPRFEVAEILNLQALRDSARTHR